MNKILSLALLAIVGVVNCQAEPLPFFMNLSSLQYGTFTPSEDDIQFDYNAETGMYELEMEYTLGQTNKMIRMYQKDGEKIIQWAPLVRTHIDFMEKREYQVYLEEDRTSPIMISDFYGDDVTAKVKFSTIPGDSVLNMMQIVDKEFIPEHIYLWGSDKGGFTNEVMATMNPTPDDPYIFTLEFEMPRWHFDPASLMADFASDAFIFYLSTSDSASKKGTTYRAYLPYETEDLSFSTIALGKGETFKTTLQTAIQESAVLSCLTPGKTSMTFNLHTLELTVTMLDPLNHVLLSFDGIKTALHNKYINVFASGEEYPLFINPQSIWYEGDLDLSVVPKEGYEVEMECLSEDAEFNLREKDGTCYLTSPQNGLAFNVTINEKSGNSAGVDAGVVPASGKVSVYNLQGIKILETENEDMLKALPAGLYIVNGKKVLLNR